MTSTLASMLMGRQQLQGVPVRFSDLALERTTVPVRRHSRRRGTPGYHGRIQKKWNKRFGFIAKPCIFQMTVPSLFGPRQMFVAHPSFEGALRAAGVVR